MKNVVEFPNLFSESIELSRIITNIIGIDIYWYGVLITIGFALSFLYAMKRAKVFGMVPDSVFDVAFVGTVGGFIGARVYYCLFYNIGSGSAYKYTLITMVTEIRDGGLAIYGGIIASIICAFIYARIKKCKLLPILDLAGLSFLIGQAIGRWGNFFNQEAYGAPTAGNLPWGMTGDVIRRDPVVIMAGDNALVHPCFLYESLWCFLGFILIHLYSKKLRSFDGEILLLYIIWYGSGRSLIESLRTDSLYLGGIKISQAIGIMSAIVALVLLVYFKFKLKKDKGYEMYSRTVMSQNIIQNFEKEMYLSREKAEAKKALKTGISIQDKIGSKAQSVLEERISDNEKGEN